MKQKSAPQFAFRVKESDKKRLQAEAQAIAALMNKNKEPGEALDRGNDVCLMALEIGFKELRRKYGSRGK